MFSFTKKLIALAGLALATAAGSTPAVAGNAQLWATVHTGPAYYGVATDPSHMFAVGRIPNPVSGDFDFLVDAFDLNTGNLLWRSRTDDGGDETAGWWKGTNSPVPIDPLTNNVVASDGKRVFAVGASCPIGDCTWPFDQYAFSYSDTSIVRAYDAKTGAILWEHVTGPGEGASQAVETSGSRVYVGGPHSLQAYDAATGALLWTRLHDFVPPALNGVARLHQLLVEGNRVFASFGDPYDGFRVRAYNASTGVVLWDDHAYLASFVGSAQTLTYAHGRLFVGGFVDLSPRNELAEQHWIVRAYEASTGALVWQDGSTSFYGEVYGCAAAANRVTCAGVEHNNPGAKFYVRTYDQKTGKIMWQDKPGFGGASTVAFNAGRTLTTDPETGAPVASQGLMLVAGRLAPPLNAYEDATIRAYNPATGMLVWARSLGLIKADDAFLGLALRPAHAYAAGTSSPDNDVTQNGLVAAFKTN